jgi:AcrR family transcriptional regulator
MGGEMKEDVNSTKDRILEAAAKLFSERGYEGVTTREIAKAIGINSASIYYYFPSKEEILRSLYEVYSENGRNKQLDLNELLRSAEIDPPHEVLMKSEYHYNEEFGQMHQILVTAARRIGADPDNERFIQENIFDNISEIVIPLTHRLVELKKIKPFDMDTFLKVFSYYCFSAAALNNSSFGANIEEYQAGISFLFSMIAPAD